MSFGLFLPRRWTRQPQGPVEIDWSNPLTRGISIAGIASQRRVFASPLAQVTSSVAPRNFSTETAWGGLSNGDMNISVPYVDKSALIDSETTILARIRRRYDGIWFSAGCLATGYQNGFPQTWNFGWGGNPLRFSANSATNVQATAQDTINSPMDRLVCYFGEVTDSTISIYRDGRLTASSPFTGGILTGYNGAGVDLGLRVNRDRNDLCDVEKFVFWKRRLSDGERLAISENSHQIFRPAQRRIYSFPSGGVTIPTLSLPGVQDITTTSARPKVTLTF